MALKASGRHLLDPDHWLTLEHNFQNSLPSVAIIRALLDAQRLQTDS